MKHKMWSRLLSMVLAVLMITSIVPTSAFAEAASEIAASSQAVAEVVEQTEEVTLPEDTTTEEPAAETPAQEPAAETPAEEPAGEPVPTAEPVAEPTAEPATENEQPTAEPTQAPAETAVPSEQPSAEPTAAPEGTETPEATAVPSATPAPSESPLPSETPVPTETPEATEEPVAMNEEAYETTADVENADITVTVNVPAGALPVDAELKADLIAEETEEFAQAQAALDEQQVEYDGMIALDIRFELNGEEIEPLYPVEVTIDAKAMLPENVDPETVTVQHLKEDESGEVVAVETVADATEETGDVTVAATQTEEAAMDMASTFAVDGFSTFTVAYGLLAVPRAGDDVSFYLALECDGEEARIPVQLVDEGGNRLDLKDPNLVVKFEEPSKTITFKNIVNATSNVYSGEDLIGKVSGTPINTIIVDGETYEYVQTDISNDRKANGLQYRGENWQYKKSNGEFSELNNDQIITFVYEKQASTEKPDDIRSIDTVNTNAKGIDLKLFNYNAQINGGSKSDDVSDDRALTFKNDGKGVDGTNEKRDEHNDPDGWLEADKYGGGLAQDIVQNTLQEGYPVTSAGTDGNCSLRYLFDEDYDTENDNLNKAVTEYPANYLFTYDSATGYYEYDSAKNAANYDTRNNRFNVYNYTEAANTDSGKENAGSFLPFNNAQGGKGSWSDRKFLFEEETVDYWFGMSMTAEFIQPKGGKVNGWDMVFEFTGDDDVWVFIDGKLVLDLGGVHSAVSGTINFANGVVSITNTKGDNVTNVPSLNEIFALGEGNSTFEDYSTHTIEYFYLERGGDVANCHIKFNLPTIPEEDLAVAKTVTQLGTNDQVSNSTLFSFVLKKNDEAQVGVPYNVYDLDAYTENPENPEGGATSGTTQDGGIFQLKANQVAVFENLVRGGDASAYTVTEQLDDALAAQVSGVYVNGRFSADKTATFADSTYAWFDNRIKDTTEYELTVTKEWKTSAGKDYKGEIPFGKVVVTVQQYYKLTVGDATVETPIGNPEKLTLDRGNQWSASYKQKVENYSYFKVESEEVYSLDGRLIATYRLDGNGNWAADPALTGDYANWTVGEFSFSRNYGEANISYDPKNRITSCKDTNFNVLGTGWVIAQLTGNSQDKKACVLWMPYMEVLDETARSVILEKLKTLSIEGSFDLGNLIFYDELENPSYSGITFTYREDGTVNIEFAHSSVWSQVAYGSFQFVDTTVDGSLTNVFSSDEKISVDVQKVWNDKADSSKRPANITVKLLKDGESFQQLTLNAPFWEGRFTNLDKYNDDGTLIKYTVKEDEVEGYEATITGDMQTGFIITNTLTDTTGKLQIKKALATDENPLGGGKDVFNFRVVNNATGETWYMHVDLAGSTSGVATVDGSKEYLDLPAGDYTITELDNLNYNMELTTSSYTKDNVTEKDDKDIVVTVPAQKKEDPPVVVNFTNTPRETKVPSDGSAVINSVQNIQDGVIIWKTEPKELGADHKDNITTSN